MNNPLQKKYNLKNGIPEAGCDEAGRGCLAGPVFAAAVILPEIIPDYLLFNLNDSKKKSSKGREKLKAEIEKNAISYAVARIEPCEIDKINILNASILAMHQALEKLEKTPGYIIVDGNKFKPFRNIEHKCLVGGDAKFLSIAAASILAKTYRDQYMQDLHNHFPVYDWAKNKGYPTREHLNALAKYGPCLHHRWSFAPVRQGKINFDL